MSWLLWQLSTRGLNAPEHGPDPYLYWAGLAWSWAHANAPAACNLHQQWPFTSPQTGAVWLVLITAGRPWSALKQKCRADYSFCCPSITWSTLEPSRCPDWSELCFLGLPHNCTPTSSESAPVSQGSWSHSLQLIIFFHLITTILSPPYTVNFEFMIIKQKFNPKFRKHYHFLISLTGLHLYSGKCNFVIIVCLMNNPLLINRSNLPAEINQVLWFYSLVEKTDPKILWFCCPVEH